MITSTSRPPEAWKINMATGIASTAPVGSRKFDNKERPLITYTGTWRSDTLSVMSSNEKNACFQVKFKGARIGFYGLARPDGGYARVTLLNSKGKRVLSSIVDMYCKYPELSLKFLSPILKKDNYSLTVSLMGEHGNWSDKRKNVYGSTGDFVSLDKLVIDE